MDHLSRPPDAERMVTGLNTLKKRALWKRCLKVLRCGRFILVALRVLDAVTKAAENIMKLWQILTTYFQ